MDHRDKDRRDENQRDGLALGYRVGLELVVAVVVGTGMGWAIDRALGTKPFGLIVFFVLGAGAGLLVVWRALTGMKNEVGFQQKDQDWSDDED